MSHEEAIKKLIIGLAQTFGVAPTKERLGIYYSVLAELSVSEMEEAVRNILQDPAIKFFPLPAQILQSIRPTLSIETAAQELLQRCISAVSAFGYCDPTGAKHYLGDIAWKAIGGSTGWVQFCCAGDFASGGTEIGTARAQLRELLKAKLLQEFPSGRLPSLPQPNEGGKVYLPTIDAEDLDAKRQGLLTQHEREEKLRELRIQLAQLAKPVQS